MVGSVYRGRGMRVGGNGVGILESLLVLVPMAAAVFAGKGHVVRAEHVERGAKRGDGPDDVDGVPDPGRGEPARGPRLPEDLVLRIEAGRERESGDGPARREIGPARDRRVLREPAHLPHVLLVMAGEDPRAPPDD